MTKTSFRMIMSVGALVFLAGCASKTAELPPPAELLPPLPEKKAWNETFEKEVIDGSVFVYTHTTRDWGGRTSISRRSLPSSALWANPSPGAEGNPTIFGLLSLLQESSRVRDVKEISEGTFALIVERGLQLILGGKPVEMDALAMCQMQGTKPLRFTFDAIPPREGAAKNPHEAEANPLVRQLQVVYQWGSRGTHWVPVDILLEVVVQQRGVEKPLEERWKLFEMRPVSQGEVAAQQEGQTTQKPVP